jgi:hypothetical protein
MPEATRSGPLIKSYQSIPSISSSHDLSPLTEVCERRSSSILRNIGLSGFEDLIYISFLLANLFAGIQESDR